MNEIIKWQDRTVDVQARLVPRYLWNTASIDVLVDGQQILRTGGQLKLKGSHSGTFTHAGSTHNAELSWKFGGLSLSFPYELRIDGATVATSRVHIRNWPVGLIAAVVVGAILLGILNVIHGAGA